MSVPKIIKVTIEQDPHCTNPLEFDDQWSLYTFGDHRLITEVPRWKFEDEDGDISNEIRQKLEVGLAFWVRYSDYLPTYDIHEYPQDGLIVWEHPEDHLGAKSVEDRREDARNFLEEYSKWANGDCYGYSIEVLQSTTPEYDPDKSLDNGAYWVDADDSCWDLIGSDYAAEEVKRAVADYEGYRIVYRGDAAHIL